MLSEELLHILRCPRCRAELRPGDRPDTLTCAGCAGAYALEGGIPILIVAEGERRD